MEVYELIAALITVYNRQPSEHDLIQAGQVPGTREYVQEAICRITPNAEA